jgi:hypothetical protein
MPVPETLENVLHQTDILYGSELIVMAQFQRNQRNNAVHIPKNVDPVFGIITK